jgi:hypothetical protein
MPKGTGIVGSDESESDGEYTLVYYQEATPAVNIINYADRVFHAADRLRHHAPTSRMRAFAADELIEVGYFDEFEGRILVTGFEDELARWLGADEVPSSELECKGAEHFRLRRQLQMLSQGANPGMAHWARTQAERSGLTL